MNFSSIFKKSTLILLAFGACTSYLPMQAGISDYWKSLKAFVNECDKEYPTTTFVVGCGLAALTGFGLYNLGEMLYGKWLNHTKPQGIHIESYNKLSDEEKLRTFAQKHFDRNTVPTIINSSNNQENKCETIIIREKTKNNNEIIGFVLTEFVCDTTNRFIKKMGTGWIQYWAFDDRAKLLSPENQTNIKNDKEVLTHDKLLINKAIEDLKKNPVQMICAKVKANDTYSEQLFSSLGFIKKEIAPNAPNVLYEIDLSTQKKDAK